MRSSVAQMHKCADIKKYRPHRKSQGLIHSWCVSQLRVVHIVIRWCPSNKHSTHSVTQFRGYLRGLAERQIKPDCCWQWEWIRSSCNWIRELLVCPLLRWPFRPPRTHTHITQKIKQKELEVMGSKAASAAVSNSNSPPLPWRPLSHAGGPTKIGARLIFTLGCFTRGPHFFSLSHTPHSTILGI